MLNLCLFGVGSLPYISMGTQNKFCKRLFLSRALFMLQIESCLKRVPKLFCCSVPPPVIMGVYQPYSTEYLLTPQVDDEGCSTVLRTKPLPFILLEYILHSIVIIIDITRYHRLRTFYNIQINSIKQAGKRNC